MLKHSISGAADAADMGDREGVDKAIMDSLPRMESLKTLGVSMWEGHHFKHWKIDRKETNQSACVNDTVFMFLKGHEWGVRVRFV